MDVVYVDGPQPEGMPTNSVFLAGPTPRNTKDKSWRPDAIEKFREMGFKGTLFVPERGDWASSFDYYSQVEWEWMYLNGASVVLFWVPRKEPNFPAFTTNVEFGRYVSIRPDCCVYGRPEWAEKCRYLDWLFERLTGRKPFDTLESTINWAIKEAAIER